MREPLMPPHHMPLVDCAGRGGVPAAQQRQEVVPSSCFFAAVSIEGVEIGPNQADPRRKAVRPRPIVGLATGRSRTEAKELRIIIMWARPVKGGG